MKECWTWVKEGAAYYVMESEVDSVANVMAFSGFGTLCHPPFGMCNRISVCNGL